MLAPEITRLRNDLGWSMSRLSVHLKVHVNLVVDWESGRRFPTRRDHLALVELRSKIDEN